MNQNESNAEQTQGMCATCEYQKTEKDADGNEHTLCICPAFMRSLYLDNGVAKCTAWRNHFDAKGV